MCRFSTYRVYSLLYIPYRLGFPPNVTTCVSHKLENDGRVWWSVLLVCNASHPCSVASKWCDARIANPIPPHCDNSNSAQVGGFLVVVDRVHWMVVTVAATRCAHLDRQQRAFELRRTTLLRVRFADSFQWGHILLAQLHNEAACCVCGVVSVRATRSEGSAVGWCPQATRGHDPTCAAVHAVLAKRSPPPLHQQLTTRGVADEGELL